MIAVSNLGKKYGSRILFEGVSFLLKQGTVTGIFGESGSGKSTLLNILGMLEQDYEGQVFVNDVLVNKNKKRVIQQLLRHEIFFLFQNYALVDNDNVEANLLIALEYTKFSKREKRTKMVKALEKVGLSSDILKTPIYILSGGEQQRVALARVYLKPNSIVLADEPTGNLDQKNGALIMEILFNLAQEENKIVVVVSHDLSIRDQCDYAVDLVNSVHI